MISWKYLFVFFTFIFDVLKILLRGLKESWILYFYQSRNFLLFLRPTNFYYLFTFLILDFHHFQNFLIFPRYCHIWTHLYINNNQNYNIYHWINASEFLILGEERQESLVRMIRVAFKSRELSTRIKRDTLWRSNIGHCSGDRSSGKKEFDLCHARPPHPVHSSRTGECIYTLVSPLVKSLHERENSATIITLLSLTFHPF